MPKTGFSSIIELRPCESPNKVVQQQPIEELLLNSPNNFVAIENTLLPKVEVKITFDKKNSEVASMLAGALTIFIQKLNAIVAQT